MNLPKAGFWRGIRKLASPQVRIVSIKRSGPKHVRSVAHTLRTTSSDDGAVTGLDGLSSKGNGLHAAGANLVDGGCVGALLEACTEGNLTSRRLADTSLDDIAEVDLLHDSRVDVLGLKSMLEGDRTKLGGREGLQGSVDRANGGPGSRDDDNFVGLEKGCEEGIRGDGRKLTIDRARKGVEKRDAEVKRDKSMVL